MNRGAPSARTTEENEPLIETEENLAYIQVCPEHPLFHPPLPAPAPTGRRTDTPDPRTRRMGWRSSATHATCSKHTRSKPAPSVWRATCANSPSMSSPRPPPPPRLPRAHPTERRDGRGEESAGLAREVDRPSLVPGVAGEAGAIPTCRTRSIGSSPRRSVACWTRLASRTTRGTRRSRRVGRWRRRRRSRSGSAVPRGAGVQLRGHGGRARAGGGEPGDG